MRKKPIICVVLALTLILAGVGYAYWTDSLNLTTRATTGDLNVLFTDLAHYAQYPNELYDTNGAWKTNWSIIDGIKTGTDDGYVPANFFTRGTDYDETSNGASYRARANGYNSVTFDAELLDAITITQPNRVYTGAKASKAIDIQVNKMYPGYAMAYQADIINVGSIAARLSDVAFNIDGSNEAVLDMLGVALYIDVESDDPMHNEDESIYKLARNFGEEATFTLGNVRFVRLSALVDYDGKLGLDNGTRGDFNLYIPGVSGNPSDPRFDLYFAIGMDADKDGVYTSGSVALGNPNGNDDANTQNCDATISMDFLWDQFNEGVDANATSWLVKQN